MSRQSQDFPAETRCSRSHSRREPSSMGYPLRSRHSYCCPTICTQHRTLAVRPYSTHLYGCSTVIPGGLPNVFQDIAHVRILLSSSFSSILPLSFQVLNRLDILVLFLSPASRNIAKSHFLSLVHKQSTGEGTLEHRQKFTALCSIFIMVRCDTRDGSWLIVILQAGLSGSSRCMTH